MIDIKKLDFDCICIEGLHPLCTSLICMDNLIVVHTELEILIQGVLL